MGGPEIAEMPQRGQACPGTAEAPWWPQRAEGAVTRGPPAWPCTAAQPSLLWRGSGNTVGNEAHGTDLPPRLGPLTFLLRKMLVASKCTPSPGTRNSWHLRPGPPRPEEAPCSGGDNEALCARGLPDRKPGPAAPSAATPTAPGPHVHPDARCGLASFAWSRGRRGRAGSARWPSHPCSAGPG